MSRRRLADRMPRRLIRGEKEREPRVEIIPSYAAILRDIVSQSAAISLFDHPSDVNIVFKP